MQLVEDSRLLPPVQATPAGLPGAEPQLQGQELPGYVVVEDEQDALETEPVRHRPRPRRALRPRRQQRLDQRPQVVVHDPRPSSHTITNSRIITPVTANQDDSARSCYELLEACKVLLCGLLQTLAGGSATRDGAGESRGGGGPDWTHLGRTALQILPCSELCLSSTFPTDFPYDGEAASVVWSGISRFPCAGGCRQESCASGRSSTLSAGALEGESWQR